MFEIISPNMLKTFKQCREKFRLKYVCNFSVPVNDEVFETGKNVHAIASYYLKGEFIDLLEKELSANESEMWSYLKNCKYFAYDIVSTEYNLSFNLNNRYLGGRLDALVKNGDKYYILDYKTGGAPKDAKYDFQTMIYLLAVREFYKTDNVVFVYLDLKNKNEVAVTLSESLSNEYKKLLNEICNEIEKSEYKASKNGCKYCEYRIICHEKLFN